MKPSFFPLFYSKRAFYKRFSLLLALWVCLVAGVGWSCGAAVTGGINLPAPTADLEGGSSSALVVLCDNIPNAPSGAFIQIINLSNRAIPTINQPLDANNNFSVQACAEVNQTFSLQVLDQNLNPISEIQQATWTGTGSAVCPTPTNQAPTCP